MQLRGALRDEQGKPLVHDPQAKGLASIHWFKSELIAIVPQGVRTSADPSAPRAERYIARVYAMIPKAYTVAQELVDPAKVAINSVQELADGSKRIDMLVIPASTVTRFELVFVAADGNIERAPFQLVVSDWEDFLKFKAKGGTRPYRIDLAPWIPFSLLNGDAVSNATALSIGARASARFGILKNLYEDPRLEFSAYGAYSFAPLLVLPDTTWNIRFLEIGGAVSYLLPWRMASWMFLVQAGWAYKNSYSSATPYAFGYQTITGPRVGVVVRKLLGLRHTLDFSAYFGLVGSGWFQLAGLDNRDFGGAIQWDWMLPYGHRIYARADVSYLQLYLSGTALNTLIGSLSIGYGL